MPIEQENYSKNQLDLIHGGTVENQQLDNSTDYVRLTVYEDDTNSFVGRYYSNQLIDGIPQIEVYTQDGRISVKPNEILETNYVAGGNYKLEFDFLRNVFKSMASTSAASDPKFVITEIAPSRKEVRLIARNDGTDDIVFDPTVFIPQFNASLSPAGEYTYDWVLTFDREKNITINNYTFDEISNPDKITLILRLNKPIPTKFKRLDKINIEKEVINTQTQKIIYISNITSTFAGSGLTPDESVWTQEVVYEDDSAENYNQLITTSSFTENTMEDILVKQDKDVNLQVDFNNFKNHILFGSAKKKLESFKTKVGKIQGYLNEISQSLYFDSLSSHSGSYIPNLRKDAFSNIQKIQSNFTPYEKFLYFDGQSQTTASAPGLGLNYAHSIPVAQYETQYTLLQNHDGFKVVHKHEPGVDQYVDLFTNQYFADETPFFNYTGSLYLSFLMKANKTISSTGGSGDVQDAKFNWENSNKKGVNSYPRIPQEALYQEYVLRPDVSGSHYQRFILHASQSHWRPTGSAVSNGVAQVANIPQANSNFTGHENTYYTIISSSNQIISASQPSSSIPIELTEDYANLGTTLTGSAVPFYGSILPAGELFRLYWRAQDYSGTTVDPVTGQVEATSSFITDVKITKNNPENTLPFAFIYPTGSNEFDTWYNGIYSQAETYDNNNIHSLVKNVPEQVITSSNDVQTFLDMWGEHFDGVRNYIDTYKTFYNRSYNEINSTPSNLLPILGANLGWELINPFSSSLSDYFSTLTGSLSTVKDMTNNTWRKVINNLVYIYKTKGTQNSLRALLNIYGYPPDLMGGNEYGGSLEHNNPTIIDDTYSTFNSGLNSATGNTSFVQEPVLYRLMDMSENELQFDYNQNDANGYHIEFNMIPRTTQKTGSLIRASGSGANSTRWHLNYIPSASSATKGKLELQISHVPSTGSIYFQNGQNNPYTASTDYFDIGNGRMFNVHLQMEETSNQYQRPKLFVLSKNSNNNIDLFTWDDIDISSIQTSSALYDVLDTTNAIANVKTGSLLIVGNSFTGSIADFRLYKNSLSASKMKQHTLNPPSVVGNQFNSMEEELVYRFKLNENSSSGSVARTKDSNPNNIKDYSKNQNFEINDGMYITKIIDTVKFVPRTDGVHKNSNMTTVDLGRGKMVRNLNPKQKSFNSNFSTISNNRRHLSDTVDLSKSPVDKIDDYITQILADKDVSEKFAKWSDLYEPFYKDLDDLRDKIMAGVSVDINKYIATQAKLFNPAILQAISSILPVRTKVKKGVSIRQSILERTKVKYRKSGLLSIPVYEGSIENYSDITSIFTINPYIGLLDDKPTLSSEIVNPTNTEILTEEMFDYSINYLPIYNSNKMNLYKDMIDFNVKNIQLIETNDLHILNPDENFSMNILNPIEFPNINLYKDMIDFSIKKTNPLSWSMNIYKDFVDYGIIISDKYDIDIDNIDYKEFLIEYQDILKTTLSKDNQRTITRYDVKEALGSILCINALPTAYKENYLDIPGTDGVYIRFVFKNGAGDSGVVEATGTPNITEGDYTGYVIQLSGAGTAAAICTQIYNAIVSVNKDLAPSPPVVATLSLENKRGEWGNLKMKTSLGPSILRASGFHLGESRYFNTPVNKSKFFDYTIDYLKIKESNIPDFNYQDFWIKNLKIHSMEIPEWEYQSYGIEYLPIYDSNKLMVILDDDFNYDNIQFIYNKLPENNIQRWPYESFNMSYLTIKETDLERWPFESFEMNYLTIKEVNLPEWEYQSFNMNLPPIFKSTILDWPPNITSNISPLYKGTLKYLESDANSDYEYRFDGPSAEKATLYWLFYSASPIAANNPANYHNATFTLTGLRANVPNSDRHLTRTYIFDNSGADVTGTLDAFGRVRVQLIGHSTWSAIRSEIKDAINSTNGHGAGKSCLFSFTEGGKSLTIVQVNPGTGGNTEAVLTGATAVTQMQFGGNVMASTITSKFSNGADDFRRIYKEESKRDQLMMNNLPIYSKDLENWPYENLNAENLNILDKDLENWPYENFDMTIVSPIEVTSKEIQNMNWMSRKESPLKNWGTKISDTWIMNLDSPGSQSNYNTGYYNDTVLNYMIQDMDYVSESYKRKLCPSNGVIQQDSDITRLCVGDVEHDASDWKTVVNRYIHDDGINADIYQSYYGDSGGTAPIKGRPIGKTTYFSTSSDGEIIYPVNHHINYPGTKYQMRYLFYEKTPVDIIVIDSNNNEFSSSFGAHSQFPGDLFPKEAFYSLLVEGPDTENILKVETKADRPTMATKKSQQANLGDDPGTPSGGGRSGPTGG